MSTTEDKMDVAESEDSGVGTGSDAMSTRSAASTATLVSCPPPAFDGGVDYFDSGLLSPTSVTSSTQWSNSGHQHHVTGHIPSGHANAAHSNASSNRGLVMDDLDSTQKTQEWVEKHQDANVEMVDVSSDSGISEVMSVASISRASSLRASRPPAVDGNLDTFDSGLLSPTSVTSSTKWSNRGHQHHVTGHIRSDDPSHHGYPHAARSIASSDSGFVSGSERPGTKVSNQRQMPSVQTQQAVNGQVMNGTRESNDNVVCTTSDVMSAQKTPSASPFVDPNQSQSSTERLVIDIPQGGQSSESVVIGNIQVSEIKSTQSEKAPSRQSSVSSVTGNSHISEIKSTQSEKAPSRQSSISSVIGNSHLSETKSTHAEKAPSRQSSVSSVIGNSHLSETKSTHAEKAPSRQSSVSSVTGNSHLPEILSTHAEKAQSRQSSVSSVTGNSHISEIKSTQSEKAPSRQSSISSVTGNSHTSEIKSTQYEKAPSRQSSVSSVTGNSHISEIKSTQSEKAPSRQSSVSSVTGNSHVSEIKSTQSEKAPSRQSSVSSVTGNSHISEIKSTQSEKAPSRQSSVSSVIGNSHLSETKSTHAEKAPSRQSSVSSVTGNSHISEIKSTQSEKAPSRQSSVSSVIGNSHISEIKSTQAHINTLVDIKASTPSRTNRTTQPAPKLIEKMDRNSFEVKVKDLKNHTEVIHARPDEKVSEFRKKVSTLTGNNSTSITTQYGATLEDNKRLSDYNIKHLDTVLSCDRMIGG